nr:hypothetical protein CFP56_19508 [Quercus suber]
MINQKDVSAEKIVERLWSTSQWSSWVAIGDIRSRKRFVRSTRGIVNRQHELELDEAQEEDKDVISVVQ